MPNYQCPFCSYNDTIKTKFIRHLEKQNKCYNNLSIRDYIINNIKENNKIDKILLKKKKLLLN